MEMQRPSPTVQEQRDKPFPWERFHGPNCLVEKVWEITALKLVGLIYTVMWPYF